MYKNYINKPDILNRYVYKILLIMRLTTVILIISMLQVSASTLAQKFTYVKKQVPLSQVFKEVKKQTGYNILWNERSMNANQLIDANFRKSSIQEVLNQCIGQLPLSFSIDGKMVFIKQKENEPSLVDKVMDLFKLIDVRGKVVDEKNEPLVGAVVRVKGTKIATSTNSKGEFTLANVDDKAVLVISFLGYEPQEITVTEKMGDVRLVMSEDRLKEVEINAGYYTVTDRERTGNITKITASTIERQPISNPLMALQNRVPGLQIAQQTGTPGGGMTVQIRGRSSLNSIVGNDPLYIIDNVIYPSATLISGIVQGILGTKGMSPLSMINPNDIESIEVLKDADATAIYGSKGANGVILIKTKRGQIGTIKVDANIQQGFSKVNRRLKLMNTEEYIEMRKEAFKNDGLAFGPRDYDVNGIWDQNKYTDWQKFLIGGTAATTTASVSAGGGSENLKFLIGGNYYQEGTVFPGDFGFKRGGMHANLNFGSAADKLNVVLTANYSRTEHNLMSGDLTNNILLPPNAPDPYDENGMLNWFNNTVYRNPMAFSVVSNQKGTDNLVANVNFDYKIFPRLSIKTSVGYSTIKGDEFSKTPLTSRTPAVASTSLNRISVFSNNQSSTLMVEPQINYRTKLAEGNFETLVGMTFQRSNSELRSVRAADFNSDALLDNITAASTLTPLDFMYAQYRYIAVFTRLNYSLYNKYYINLTARRDGSSRFGDGKQFANFGAIGAAWIFSEEPLIKENLTFLNLGKLRVSYGITGNDQISDYGYLQLWNSLSGTYQGTTTLQPAFGSTGNADFAWESNRKFEAALQLTLIKNRLNLEVSWYQNRSSNQLIGDPLPLSTGSPSITANRDAIVQNTGLEIACNFNVFKNSRLAWNTGVNITIPRSKLIAYPDLESSADAYNYIVGEPLTIRRVFNVRGIDSQTGLYDIEDRDGNGIYNDNDRYLHKFTGQYFYGGIQNTLQYKQFTFDFLLGFTKQNSTSNYMGSFNPGRWDFSLPTTNMPTVVLNRWKTVGDEVSISKSSTTSAANTNYSRARTNGGESIVDASFFRLKNASITYNLPKKWISRLKINDVRFSIQGQNLFTISNYIGLDPESQSMAYLPPLRTVSFGLNVTL